MINLNYLPDYIFIVMNNKSVIQHFSVIQILALQIVSYFGHGCSHENTMVTVNFQLSISKCG